MACENMKVELTGINKGQFIYKSCNHHWIQINKNKFECLKCEVTKTIEQNKKRIVYRYAKKYLHNPEGVYLVRELKEVRKCQKEVQEK